jgi:hypothetical protein
VSNAGTGEGSFTANLSGLSPATLYYARAFATNATGTSYGSQVSFTTQPGTPVQTVNVTYKVDVSNYIAAGNTIAGNGIRIAGNFANRGAKVNGTAMVNWTPTDTASRMTNTGNNIWTIDITYPDSSIAKTQTYKFVNNDWGTNEGLAGSTIASAGCGVDDGAGNINRTLLIPAANSNLTYCWDQCTSTCVITSLEEISLPIAAYPNPFTSNLMIESQKGTKFRLISVLGKVVMEGQLKQGQNNIQTTGLGNGLYILNIEGLPAQRLLKK